MTREEAIKIIDCYDIGFYDLSGEKIPAYKLADAFYMAIEALSADTVSREDYHNLLTASNDIDRALREYQAKEEHASAEAVQGWIPCSERLPDIKEHHVSDPCLVYCENGVYGFAELEENIFGQVGWNCEREDEYHEPIGDVLAWMPLPKPYKGGDTE